ncbi:MAG: hypothetical protein FXF54_02065, partial [Kosmotoga sp.]
MKKRKILVIVITALIILTIMTGCPQKNNQIPTLTKISGPSGTINESSSTFSWSGNDPDGSIDHYEYRKDGGSWNTATGTSYTWSGYSEGSHNFNVRAQDDDKHFSKVITWNFVYSIPNCFDLKITVKDVNNKRQKGVEVYLYDDNWNYIETNNTNENGEVIFEELTPSFYHYEVYFDPEKINEEPEYWGAKTIEIIDMDVNNEIFERNLPTITDTFPSENKIPYGEISPIMKTQSTDGATYTLRARFIFDKDKTGSYDYDYTTNEKLVESGIVELEGETYNITQETNMYVVLETKIGGTFCNTDQFGWLNLLPQTNILLLTVSTTPEKGLEIQIEGTNCISPKTMSFNEDEKVEIGVTSVQEKDRSNYIEGMDTRYVFSQW